MRAHPNELKLQLYFYFCSVHRSIFFIYNVFFLVQRSLYNLPTEVTTAHFKLNTKNKKMKNISLSETRT